jgi:hypothetical protein
MKKDKSKPILVAFINFIFLVGIIIGVAYFTDVVSGLPVTKFALSTLAQIVGVFLLIFILVGIAKKFFKL